MRRAGIEPPGLQARDGLAAINGSNLLTAMSALHIYDMERWLKQAEIAAAMSIEALLGNMKPYNTKLHELRGFKGAITSAGNIARARRRLGPDHRQDEDQGAGCLLHALHAAGHRRGAGRDRLRPLAGGDRIERGGRQPHLRAGTEIDADRGELPGFAGGAAHGYGGRGHHHGVRAVRAQTEPFDQPGPLAGTAGLPGARTRLLLRADAQPVHGGPPDRGAADPELRPPASSPSPPPRTRRTSSRWA